MDFLVSLLALVLLAVGIFLARDQKGQELKPLPEPELERIAPPASPSPSSQPSRDQNIADWQYPRARIVKEEGSSLSLESQDDVDAITNWYKEKIKNSGMNTKSFVVTKTNGNVLNSLVGAKEGKEIRVKITKADSETSVLIDIKITSS
jgi:hypothetical protein